MQYDDLHLGVLSEVLHGFGDVYIAGVAEVEPFPQKPQPAHGAEEEAGLADHGDRQLADVCLLEESGAEINKGVGRTYGIGA